MSDALEPYFAKRNFSVTGEPRGGRVSRTSKTAAPLRFVVQKHAARSLHYDFRLELEGTLKSWAVPKGPSLDPADKRMAVQVEDHPLEYGDFEGTIPAGQYGAGTVIVWDRGTWAPSGDAALGWREGKLKFELRGSKLKGAWTLVRMHGHADEKKKPWLLIKERDGEARPAAEYSVVEAEPDSVLQPPSNKPAPRRSAPADSAHSDSPPSETPPSKTAPSKTAPSKTARGKHAPAKSRSAKPSSSAALPRALAPQLATLASGPPSSGEWAWEIKFDGYRLLARVDGEDVRLFTRNGHDWTSRMPGLADAVRGLDLGSAWLDGEIVVSTADGKPDFNALQNALDSEDTGAIEYFVFDLPFHDGVDLRKTALHERRSLLEQLIARTPRPRVHFSQSFDAKPGDLLQSACRLQLEGVIGKRIDAPYVSRRSPTWIKLKCTHRQEFVIGGWTDPKGSRPGLGSLLLGLHEAEGQLRFVGGVGSGFDEATLLTLRRRLEPLGTAKAPFSPAPKGVKAHWVEPRLVAEVSFGDWTPDGHLRHAVFHALREDKPADEIVREHAVAPARTAAAKVSGERPGEPAPIRPNKAAASSRPAKAEVAGIRISHPDRVVDTSTGTTKLDVANHYLRVAEAMLPHLARRPVSLVRAPSGIGGQLFFQRHAESLKIDGLIELDAALVPGKPPMVAIGSSAALIGAAQANVIEFHTWNATTRNTTNPDRMVFDLDPGEGVAWRQMQEGTELMHALLDQLGLTSFLKTSGGKGLHVVVPITPTHDWDTVKAFSKAVVEHMAKVIPERFVAKSGPKNRVGRIFVDYLRNGFGATTACAWSLRARPGLGVSVPCDWSELQHLRSGDQWTIDDVGKRLEARADAWQHYAATRQTLVEAMKTLGFAAER